MRSSLGLYGDLDDVELLEDVERAFRIRLPRELPHCHTVGDLFELIVDRLPDGDPEAGRCATAMAFYRLRRAVLTLAPDVTLRPATPLDGLSSVPVRSLDRAFRKAEGVRVPDSCRPARGGPALLLAVALPIGILLSGAPVWAALLALPLSAALYQLSPLRFPRQIKTIGDLAERVAAHNVGMLAARGGRLGPAEAWRALRTICASHSMMVDADGIGADTLILDPRRIARQIILGQSSFVRSGAARARGGRSPSARDRARAVATPPRA
jgi:hypothetical protein